MFQTSNLFFLKNITILVFQKLLPSHTKRKEIEIRPSNQLENDQTSVGRTSPKTLDINENYDNLLCCDPSPFMYFILQEFLFFKITYCLPIF